MQSRGNGVRRGTKIQFPESTKTIKGHDLYFGSLLFLTKTAPSPRFRANPYFKYDIDSGRLLIPEAFQNTIKKLDELLRGAEQNANVQIFEPDVLTGDE